MIVGFETDLEEMANKVILESKSNMSIEDHNPTHNQFLELEIEVLQWVLDVKSKQDNDLHSLKRIIQERINKLYIELENTRNISNTNKISYIINILKPCLFIISLNLGEKGWENFIKKLIIGKVFVKSLKIVPLKNKR